MEKNYKIIEDKENCNVNFYFKGAMFWVQYHEDVDEFVVYDLASNDSTPHRMRSAHSIKLMEMQLKIDELNNHVYQLLNEKEKAIKSIVDIKEHLEHIKNETHNFQVRNALESIIEDTVLNEYTTNDNLTR